MTTTSTYRRKSGADQFFYFIDQDIINALQFLPNARVGIAGWLLIKSLQLPEGPQGTDDF